MATLTVWKFDNPAGADEAESACRGPVQPGARHHPRRGDDQLGVEPETEDSPAAQSHRRRSTRRWLLGTAVRPAVLRPLLGAAIGAAVGSIAEAMRDVGIDDDFVKTVQGGDAGNVGAVRVDERSGGGQGPRRSGALHPELIQTNLSEDEEAKLREAFAEN